MSRWLLSDAELAEDCVEQIVVGDFSGDFSQMIEGMTNILSQKIVGNSFLQAGQDTVYCLLRPQQAGMMPGIGDDHSFRIQPMFTQKTPQPTSQTV